MFGTVRNNSCRWARKIKLFVAYTKLRKDFTIRIIKFYWLIKNIIQFIHCKWDWLLKSFIFLGCYFRYVLKKAEVLYRSWIWSNYFIWNMTENLMQYCRGLTWKVAKQHTVTRGMRERPGKKVKLVGWNKDSLIGQKRKGRK